MPLLRRRTVDTKTEEQILTGMVISDTFCRDIAKLIGKDTIETPYIARAIRWCQEYYYKYKEAPGAHITDIFEVEKENIDPAEAEAISALLTKLSEEYSTSEINDGYIKDRAIELIKTRALKQANAKQAAFIELGQLDEAEEVMATYRQVSIETSGWEDPFNPEVIKNHFIDEQSNKNSLFMLSGEIGKFIGPFERNCLIGILAPAKRGKTFWAIEFVLQAVFSRRKSILVSLEMNLPRIRKRIYNRLTSMSRETKDYIYPVFDCYKNQDNSCNKKERPIGMRLLDSDGGKPVYTIDLKYRACEACRGTKDFMPATWLTTTKVEKMKSRRAIKMLNSQAIHIGYNSISGSNLRILAYPAFSANLKRVKNDIEKLADAGFIAEATAIDYPDILAPEDARVVGRERIDQTWKTLKGMSDEMNCCIFAPSQANRGSFDKKNVVQTDISEDVRKIANSDKFLAINQTPQEKKASVTRISQIAARDSDFDQYSSVIVLQQLALGQICLDSYLDKATTVTDNFYDEYFI